MIYHLKGLIARFLDIFDPDDVHYTVKPQPLEKHNDQRYHTL
jgi:hypothetical protein